MARRTGVRGGAGALRHRVELQSKGSTALPDGTRELSWATDRVLWAAVEPLRETERVEGNRVEGIRTHRIRIRAPQTTVTGDQRVVWNDRGRERIFLIDGAVEIHERRVETVLQCMEVDNDGERL